MVVRVDDNGTRASVIWSAAMSSADPTTTNNRAEYNGLIVGLRAARANSWSPLEVIGDSMLIIRQMQQYRPPTNAVLREQYAIARQEGDSLGIRFWHHHPRAANKMADAAANLAMDTAASSQVHHPTDRHEHQAIGAMLTGDFLHWREGASLRGIC